MVLNLASKLTKCETLDEGMNCSEPVNVIYQTAEDGLADTVKPRLESAGADCTRIMVIDESDKSLSMVDERSEEAAREENISKRTLENAKHELGIKAKKMNDVWYWVLREDSE